jgi:hypothetical protein
LNKSSFIESAFGKISGKWDRHSTEGIQRLERGLLCSDFRKIEVCQVVLYQIKCVRIKIWGYDGSFLGHDVHKADYSLNFDCIHEAFSLEVKKISGMHLFLYTIFSIGSNDALKTLVFLHLFLIKDK